MVSGSKRVGRLRARNQAAATAREAVALKAVGYLRVSTEEQAATGHGLEAQERAIRAFAQSQGYDLVDVITDAGVSGATKPADRPGFAQVLELAAGGTFSVLLVKTFDRLARHIGYAVTTTNELGASFGVMLRSVSEAAIDTASPAGKMMFAVFAAMAEAERDTITDRTKSGRLQKATKGGFAGGRAPYGYERDLQGNLRIVPAQARVVRRIFAERARRRTLQQIADRLNADGIPSPSGSIWRPDRVAYVLDNPKYTGNVEYLFRTGAVETHVLEVGQHDPIIKQDAEQSS